MKIQEIIRKLATIVREPRDNIDSFFVSYFAIMMIFFLLLAGYVLSLAVAPKSLHAIQTKEPKVQTLKRSEKSVALEKSPLPERVTLGMVMTEMQRQLAKAGVRSSVRVDDGVIRIMPGMPLFDSGSAILDERVRVALMAMSRSLAWALSCHLSVNNPVALKSHSNASCPNLKESDFEPTCLNTSGKIVMEAISFEGHTDSLTLRKRAFYRSNRELSMARASAVTGYVDSCLTALLPKSRGKIRFAAYGLETRNDPGRSSTNRAVELRFTELAQ